MAIGPDGLRWGFTSMVPDALPALPGRQWQGAGGSARVYTLLHACTRMAFAYRRRPRACQAATTAGPATLSPPCHRLSLPVSRITLTQGRKTGDYCRLAGG